MELRIRGERAVLAGQSGSDQREVDPGSLPLDADLTEALHEWARVAAAVQRADEGEAIASGVVSQRGRQLAGRLAATMGAPVSYLDPLSGTATLVPPPEPPAVEVPVPAPPPVRRRFLRMFDADRHAPEPTPWATGLAVAAFVAVVVVVAIVALAGALAGETAGWLAIVATVVVTAGLAPSLWLGRRLPILRWVALGVAAGLALSWIPVLVIAL